MKKRYRIRPNSVADYFIQALPVGIISLAFIIVAGLITTWDMGLF